MVKPGCRKKQSTAHGCGSSTPLEIDENLIRRDLTPSQRAKFTAARKKAYVAAHPETRHGATPGKAGGGKVAAAKNAKFASFVDDTSGKTGRSKRSIEVDVARAEALGDVIERVSGTSLERGVELDALVKLSEADCEALIDRTSAGERVSAICEPVRILPPDATEPKPGYSELTRTFQGVPVGLAARERPEPLAFGSLVR